MKTHLALVLLANTLLACGKEEAGTAKVVMQLDQTQELHLVDSLAAFSMSFKVIHLINDGNGKDATNVWMNPACDQNDSAQCVGLTTDFYDMMDPEALNSTLNDQAREFTLRSDNGENPDSVSFKFVRFYVCEHNGTVTSFKWSAASVVDGEGASTCVFDSVEMDPPLVVKKDSVAKVKLSYTLVDEMVYRRDETSAGKTRNVSYESIAGECSEGSDGVYWCFDVPKITASVIVE